MVLFNNLSGELTFLDLAGLISTLVMFFGKTKIYISDEDSLLENIYTIRAVQCTQK